jgi:hypothetical protein
VNAFDASQAEVRMIPAVPDMAEDVMRLDQLLHGRAAWTADLTAGEIRRPDSCWLAACVGDQLVGIVGGRLVQPLSQAWPLAGENRGGVKRTTRICCCCWSIPNGGGKA